MKRIYSLIPLVSLWTVSFSSSAQHWSCYNDIEVGCSTTGCQAATDDEFTPVDVRFNDKGDMDICMYSGCWHGHGDVLSETPFLVLLGQNLTWNNPQQPQPASALISLERETNVAVLQVLGFHEPILCDSGSDK